MIHIVKGFSVVSEAEVDFFFFFLNQIIGILSFEKDTLALIKAVKNGTPLPKGHGRIADMDEAIKCIEDVTGDDAIYAIALIEWACGKRTIIEADTDWRLFQGIWG